MAFSAATYLEKYFDCVDIMPLEVQRSVTRLREIELQHRRLLGEVDVLRVQMEGAVGGGNETEMGVAIQRLQHCMLAVRELGNMKMEVSSQLLDTVEEYGQQLSLCAKELDSPCRGHDDHHHHSPRHTSTSSHSHSHNGKNDSQLVQSDVASEKTAAKRTSSAKKPRSSQMEKPREREDTPPVVAGLAPENNTTNSGGGGGGVGGGVGLGGVVSGNKLPRKKIKAKKKATKEPAVSLPDPTHLPMPDLSSQPIDPDEPLYCHCQQVSFGEMIGCDNDDCPIEWFHFQCVGLTSKPKGKWYCPQCAPDRKAKSAK